MAKRYFLNGKTYKLHIEGYCKESTYKPYKIIYFNSQDEALAHGGTAVSMCKTCQKKREKLMREMEK